MTPSKKRRGRPGCHPATPRTSNKTRKSTALAPRIKAAIVTLALWGWVPVKVAEWLIRHGGLRDA